jgi:hypothetical protein
MKLVTRAADWPAEIEQLLRRDDPVLAADDTGNCADYEPLRSEWPLEVCDK